MAVTRWSHISRGRPLTFGSRLTTGLQSTLDRSFVRNIAFTTIDLSTCYVRLAEIDEAARHLGDASHLATRCRWTFHAWRRPDLGWPTLTSGHRH